ncbi:MAG TPA: DUF4242 domain-containing protein [Mucilaginibacter sp.]|jgi:hypothetical protein|nr:DUF4242 domain-containing protein [Mucilaginibacter sp.]
MKSSFLFTACAALVCMSLKLSAQSGGAPVKDTSKNNLYIDVHHFGPGNVKYDDVVKAHAKDVAVQRKYGVRFINFWVDEKGGDVYCLSSAPDTMAIRKTHGEAHGMLPGEIYLVTSGTVSALNSGKNFFLDIHNLGPGNVTANAVAAAHLKDLAVEKKYGVNFINYWVNEKRGVVMCLSQAPDSTAIIDTHKEAHGLIPARVMLVKPGDSATE